MQDASYAEAAAVRASAGLSVTTKAAMILLGYVPLLHASATAAVFFMPLSLPLRALLAFFILLIVPPLITRLVAVREGTFRPGESGFLRWWTVNQLQTLFNRIPLEEIIRLVPAAYSMWLRLWGASIGSLVYWAPRAVILDRGLLEIGNGAVIGAGARLATHALTRTPGGEFQLIVARISIERSAIVGAWSTIGPGARVAEGESVTAAAILGPFRTWRGGRPRQNDGTD